MTERNDRLAFDLPHNQDHVNNPIENIYSSRDGNKKSPLMAEKNRRLAFDLPHNLDHASNPIENIHSSRDENKKVR